MIDIEHYKQRALKILSPIKSANGNTWAPGNFLFNAQKSDCSYSLPEYYLVYFLLGKLLNFYNIGRYEKIAWSFPIEYHGKPFLIEYRKFGLGVFTVNIETDEKDVEEIVFKINRAVKGVTPYFDFLAEEAVQKSELNIVNNNKELYERYNYFLAQYKRSNKKYLNSLYIKNLKTRKADIKDPFALIGNRYELNQKVNWYAISCIEAFFSWTEHLFIHLAVISQSLSDGDKITRLISGEWKIKFSTAIPITAGPVTKFYNDLLIVRQQLRNFVAHGAFGKEGNAFTFHSPAGAVPVMMNHKQQKNRFSLHGTLNFQEDDVINLIEEFVAFLKEGYLKPAMHYTQEAGLPTIVTCAADGTYKKAMSSMKEMEDFTLQIAHEFDNAVNMDW